MSISKNIIIVILSITVVVLAVMHFGPCTKDDCKTCGKDKAACVEGCTHDLCICTNSNDISVPPKEAEEQLQPPDPVIVTNEHSSVSSKDVDRLVAQKITAIAEAQGAGRYSKFCYKTSGKFHYIHTIDAESRVLSQKAGADGIVEVEEERTFGKAREVIELDDVDFALSTERIHLDDIEAWAATISSAAGVVSTASEAVPWVVAAADIAKLSAEGVIIATETLRGLDGVSISNVFGKMGLPVPKWITRIVKSIAEKEAMKRMEQVHGRIQKLEGSTYIFSYFQEEEGAPMNICYRRKDGKCLSGEERDVLDSVNAFMDSKLVPDENLGINQEWSVEARDIGQILGTATGGRLSGELNLKRREDMENGLWRIEVLANRLRVLDEKGCASGAIVIDKDCGQGSYDPKSRTIVAMQVIAHGKLNVETMRKILFVKCVTRSEGECEFRSTYVAQPLK